MAHIRFHDLRHSHCAHLIAAGRNPKEISRRLGHASVSFTLDRYGHLMPGRAQDVADRLDALARAAVVDAIPPAVRLDGRDFRGMDANRAGSRRSENRA